ncbi:MAG TPA: hypothetical protein VFO74_01665 [Pseudolabrys sp.]|nr:hypothetical protein [Pseudolabrys sp.]
MHLITAILEELIGTITGETAGDVGGKSMARLAAIIRRRVSVPLIALAWVVALAVTVLGWQLGVSGATGVPGVVAVAAWIGAPVAVLALTGLWFHRRDA